jgi:adenylate kinase family enzyme
MAAGGNTHPSASTRKVVIIGNCGSGKSHLAQAMSNRLDLPILSLDAIFWQPGGFNVKRAPEEMEQRIADSRQGTAWIVEGVFGDLAVRFLDLAGLLIWLDLPWEACRSNLRERVAKSSRPNDPAQAEKGFSTLLAWSAEYGARTDLRSHSGHERLFREFQGWKVRLCSRSEIDAFIRERRGQPSKPGWP